MEKKNRLSKYLAQSGVASRRAAEDLIFAGRVTVNGEKALLPQTMVNDEDEILVDGKKIEGFEDKVYFILNKPKGFLCSTKGASGSKFVLDLFKDEPYRLFTVGRLDKESEGLIIVTNDGHFANQVIHPSASIEKEYLVKTDQEVTDLHLKAISQGTLIEGIFLKPLKVEKVRRGTIKITIAEGKKREVRLLLEAAGLKTESLIRIRIGGLVLGPIPSGQYRPMTDKDKKLLLGHTPK